MKFLLIFYSFSCVYKVMNSHKDPQFSDHDVFWTTLNFSILGRPGINNCKVFEGNKVSLTKI